MSEFNTIISHGKAFIELEPDEPFSCEHCRCIFNNISLIRSEKKLTRTEKDDHNVMYLYTICPECKMELLFRKI
jgi:hypothetical protein